jgi:hypothetical protein
MAFDEKKSDTSDLPVDETRTAGERHQASSMGTPAGEVIPNRAPCTVVSMRNLSGIAVISCTTYSSTSGHSRALNKIFALCYIHQATSGSHRDIEDDVCNI